MCVIDSKKNSEVWMLPRKEYWSVEFTCRSMSVEDPIENWNEKVNNCIVNEGSW